MGGPATSPMQNFMITDSGDAGENSFLAKMSHFNELLWNFIEKHIFSKTS